MGVMFTIGLLAQGGFVCPDHAYRGHLTGHHHHHAGMPMHTNDPAPAPSPCCWTVATCTSPAVAASCATTDELIGARHRFGPDVPLALPSLSFAPETPPPRA